MRPASLPPSKDIVKFIISLTNHPKHCQAKRIGPFAGPKGWLLTLSKHEPEKTLAKWFGDYYISPAKTLALSSPS